MKDNNPSLEEHSTGDRVDRKKKRKKKRNSSYNTELMWLLRE